MKEEFWTNTIRSISKAYEKTGQEILLHIPDPGGQAIEMRIDHAPNTERGSIENRVNKDGIVAVNVYASRSTPVIPNFSSLQVTVHGHVYFLFAHAESILMQAMSDQEAVDIAKKTKDEGSIESGIIVSEQGTELSKD
ncbi:probable protein phosphatase 2C 10 [Gossypium raimondii]|uniref:probable protein phosphatase 2C 10 n=1 Tax=Gossypium raimondii TaxID=29730 RepID=UPI00227C73A3|nr:probable protein phosphatase 2C 10 [Gossypium raimondii]